MGPLSFEEDLDAAADDEMLAGEDLAVGALGSSGISAAYDAAIKRLLAQRSGLTSRERLGAALVGFGQPSPHGWRGGVANASQALLAQSLQERKQDELRRAQLEKLMLGRDVSSSKDATAMAIAKLKVDAAARKGSQGSVQVIPDGVGGFQAFRKRFDEKGNPLVENVPVGAADVDIPETATPEDAAKYPNSPVVKTPHGLMSNPFYKGA